MKKLIALICMITCIFGLTACGNEKALTDYEQQKVDYAEDYAAQMVVPLLADADIAAYSDYTEEEVEYVMQQSYGIYVEGNAVVSAISSFDSALKNIGAIVTVGEAAAVIDDDTIIVIVPVEGELKNAEAEVIFSNDMFMTLQSAALNEEATLGDAMTRAALNTLIGMGTVFAVLILISFIISLFGFIPKIQAAFSKKKDDAVQEAPKAAPAPVVVEEDVDYSDDLELVAVIAAAIAAFEGETTTDGFVVRSIRKANRRR